MLKTRLIIILAKHFQKPTTVNELATEFGDEANEQPDDYEMRSVVSTNIEDLNLNDEENKTFEVDLKKFREERENLQWPDEVETPGDGIARQRFAKYRGLKSFRHVLFYYLYTFIKTKILVIITLLHSYPIKCLKLSNF